ncbi:hypothetical protein GLYMA_17G127050v4 [Glycine max]|nr:hypothetical protein GLYMA_17G127050v4 [Glycine max]KAH1118204.1 hypothetical protein GYH30_047103 [Glycine max]
MSVWKKMALSLVFMLPNSSCFSFSETKKATPINTGAQSTIFPENQQKK